MKKLLAILLIVLCVSCERKMYRYTVNITYQNGEKEIVEYEHCNCSEPRLDDGCIFTGFNQLRCGVRNFNYTKTEVK